MSNSFCSFIILHEYVKMRRKLPGGVAAYRGGCWLNSYAEEGLYWDENAARCSEEGVRE